MKTYRIEGYDAQGVRVSRGHVKGAKGAHASVLNASYRRPTLPRAARMAVGELKRANDTGCAAPETTGGIKWFQWQDEEWVEGPAWVPGQEAA